MTGRRPSAGPRTPAGKQASRHNALKHGLTAKSVVLRGVESPGKFRALVERLRSELNPVGTLEEMQVERIAAAYWRWQRALRFEAGEMFLDLDEVKEFTLPEPTNMNNVLRYEARLEHEYYRAVKELERLQRRRLERKTPTHVM